MGQSLVRPPDPCVDLLEHYVKCMHAGQGRVPDQYELEFCTEERELYKVCREADIAARKASKSA